MSKGQNRRQRIFDKYVANRNLLIDKGFIQGEKDVYLCPLCTTEHTSINEDDPLSLEDAPQKSLGGRANILTCESCNNLLGQTIDHHLTNRLKNIEKSKFQPNTRHNVNVEIEGEWFRGELTIDSNGKIEMFHPVKHNNPLLLDMAMDYLEELTIVDIKFTNKETETESVEYAILKTAYLVAFEKLGGLIIFDSCFDIVRQQLKNIRKRIYPKNFFYELPKKHLDKGVYIYKTEGFECMMSIFDLHIGKSSTRYAVLLPFPTREISVAIDNINKLYKLDMGFKVTAESLVHNVNYLKDVNAIKRMLNFIEKER